MRELTAEADIVILPTYRLERMQGFLRRRPPLQRVAIIALMLIAGLFAVMLLFGLLLSVTLIGT